MKVLVVNPYSEKVLNGLREIALLRLCEFILVGEKIEIMEKCYRNNIQSKLFTIYDIVDDMDIIDFCKKSLDEGESDYIVFDDFPEQYQYRIIRPNDKKEIGNVDILDLPFLRHFVFVSNYSKNHNIDFEEKKKSILQANEIMLKLGIKKTNAALITNLNNKTDMLEASIISMILNDSNLNNIKIFDNFNIFNLFIKESKVNIYKNNINLFVFRNYESSRIFLDTLNAFTNTKMASFLLGDYMAIDAKALKDDNNIIFSLLILSKLYKANDCNKSLISEIS